MTKNDEYILNKFKTKQSISRHEMMSVEHLQKLNLIKIDNLYKNTVNTIIIYYAQTTELGLDVLKNLKQKKKKRFFIF